MQWIVQHHFHVHVQMGKLLFFSLPSQHNNHDSLYLAYDFFLSFFPLANVKSHQAIVQLNPQHPFQQHPFQQRHAHHPHPQASEVRRFTMSDA